MTEINVSDIMKVILRANAERPCITFGEKKFTYKEEDARSNQLTRALMDLDLKRDDKLGMMVYTCNQYTDAMFSSMKHGFFATNVNYRYVGRELRYILDNADIKYLVVDEPFIDEVRSILPETNVKYAIVIDRGEGRKIPKDWFEYESLIRKYPTTEPKIPWRTPIGDEPILLFHSGGTTGYPKGVLMNLDIFKGLIGDVGGIIAGIFPGMARIPDNNTLFASMEAPFLDKILHTRIVHSILSQPDTGKIFEELLRRFAPIAFTMSMEAIKPILYLIERIIGGRYSNMILAQSIAGMGMAPLFAFGVLPGQHSILLPYRTFDPKMVFEAIERERPNIMTVVGDTMAKMLCEFAKPGEFDTRSLRIILSAGMAMTPRWRQELMKRFPNGLFLDWYGSTEAFLSNLNLYTPDMLDAPTTWRLPESYRIVDDNFNIVPHGEDGEIVIVPGSIASMGYYKVTDEVQKTYKIIDGKKWIRTGDRGYIDKDTGRLVITGRGSEVINTGGMKVWCEEVEDEIRNHPAVSGVAVVGVPDEKWGESVTAIVELKEGAKITEEELRNWCRDKLADFKIPKRIIFDKVEYIDGEKVWHFHMKKVAVEHLGIKEKKK